MGRRQHRRSISFSAVTYERIRRYCFGQTRAEGQCSPFEHRSLAGWLEEIANRELDKLGEPRVERREVIIPRPRPADADGVLRSVRAMAGGEG